MKQILYIFVIVLLYSCSSTKLATEKELSDLNSTLDKGYFIFEANSANPVAFANVRGIENLLPPGSNTASINLVNNPNYLRVRNDSLYISLPYFGEQQLSIGYNSSNSGIQFEGIPKKTTSKFNKKKQKQELVFDVRTEGESLKMVLTLYPNRSAKLDVNSSHRTSIFYYGKWKPIE
jgi:hypothetical protein